MNSVGKIIFIKENQSLIMEISPCTEMYKFIEGLLPNLILDNGSNEQPIKSTSQSRKKVNDFLERKYSNIKEINRLIKFFRDLPNEKYIYIYPYNKECDEVYDILKKSLVYYNQGETDASIISNMQDYIETQKKQKIFWIDIAMICK